MLPISYKSTSYYHAHWIGQYAAFQGLSISGLQGAPMNFVSWVFWFPSEVMGDVVSSGAALRGYSWLFAW